MDYQELLNSVKNKFPEKAIEKTSSNQQKYMRV